MSHASPIESCTRRPALGRPDPAPRLWRVGVLCVASVLLLGGLSGCTTVNSQRSTPGYGVRRSEPDNGPLNLGGLFQKEPPPPKTVRDFMSLSRPEI